MCVFVPSRVRLLFAQCFYNAFPVYMSLYLSSIVIDTKSTSLVH